MPACTWCLSHTVFQNLPPQGQSGHKHDSRQEVKGGDDGAEDTVCDPAQALDGCLQLGLHFRVSERLLSSHVVGQLAGIQAGVSVRGFQPVAQPPSFLQALNLPMDVRATICPVDGTPAHSNMLQGDGAGGGLQVLPLGLRAKKQTLPGN